MDFSAHRKDYQAAILIEEDLPLTPEVLFQVWFEERLQLQVPDPNAMILATTNSDGQPAVRTVLLKELQAEGFVFYTNYQSRKGLEIAQNPQVALLFYWPELERQVRVEGTATQIARTVSEAYFSSRPRDSQIGAWASVQSQVLDSRHVLEARVAELEKTYAQTTVPCPPFWGGYCVQPHYFEFWQGRSNRLHDRLTYTWRRDGQWQIQRLSP